MMEIFQVLEVLKAHVSIHRQNSTSTPSAEHLLIECLDQTERGEARVTVAVFKSLGKSEALRTYSQMAIGKRVKGTVEAAVYEKRDMATPLIK